MLLSMIGKYGIKQKGSQETSSFKGESIIKREKWLIRDGERGRVHPLSHQSTQNYVLRGSVGTSQ
jgi:hypothetical protein